MLFSPTDSSCEYNAAFWRRGSTAECRLTNPSSTQATGSPSWARAHSLSAINAGRIAGPEAAGW